MKKWVLVLFWLGCCLGILTALSWSKKTDLQVIFCDVGQGDAILIQSGTHQILVDSGPKNDVLSCLTAHMPIADRTIELLIATHPDADHIGGMAAVLDRFQVQSALVRAVGKENQTFLRLREALLEEKEQGMQLWLAEPGEPWPQNMTINDIQITLWADSASVANPQLLSAAAEPVLSDILATQEREVKNYNDLSIALILEYEAFTLTLTGDLEKEGELALKASGLLTKTTLFKAGHHGANTSSSQDILTIIRPEHSVISSGQNNRYGHPNPEALARMSRFSSQIWRTDEQGAIEATTDGQKYWVKTQK